MQWPSDVPLPCPAPTAGVSRPLLSFPWRMLTWESLQLLPEPFPGPSFTSRRLSFYASSPFSLPLVSDLSLPRLCRPGISRSTACLPPGLLSWLWTGVLRGCPQQLLPVPRFPAVTSATPVLRECQQASDNSHSSGTWCFLLGSRLVALRNISLALPMLSVHLFNLVSQLGPFRAQHLSITSSFHDGSSTLHPLGPSLLSSF